MTGSFPSAAILAERLLSNGLANSSNPIISSNIKRLRDPPAKWSPKQHSSGGKERLGSISKQGDRYLHSLFVAGALAVIRYAKIHGTVYRPWLTALLGRRPTKVAAIALANKIARMTLAVDRSLDAFQPMGQPSCPQKCNLKFSPNTEGECSFILVEIKNLAPHFVQPE
jgi:Transposase IS116/IS110/IS902 family